MKNGIKILLQSIEKQFDIRILFAIENGSRSWGMASKNSDYDVRFVFYRNVDKYLSLNRNKDVINLAFDKNLTPCNIQGSLIDMSGFDIFKYMHLLYKSNPTTIEWLFSDILYCGDNNLPLRNYMEKNFNPQTLFLHYFSLFKKTYQKNILNGKLVTYKKYLYSARGLLNALYVRNFDKIPPISIKKTIESVKTLLPADILSKLQELIYIKSQGLEKDQVAQIKELNAFFDLKLKDNQGSFADRSPQLEDLNQFLQDYIFKQYRK